MEETKNTKPASQPDKGNKGKKEKKDGSFLAEHRAELRKVTWPNRQELFKETVTVIVVSLIVGVIIFAMDYVLSLGYDKLSSLSGGSQTSVTSGSTNTTPIDLNNLPEGVEIITTDGTEEDAAADEAADDAADDTAADAEDNAGADEAADTAADNAEENADSQE